MRFEQFLNERTWTKGPGERRRFRKGKYDFDRPSQEAWKVGTCPACKSDDVEWLDGYTKCRDCDWNNKKHAT